MKKYKELYYEQREKTEYWIRKCEELLAEKAVEPYIISICFKNGESADIVDVIKHEVNYTNCHPYYNPENWKITTADGLVSVFKYDEVKYILAYRNEEYNGEKPKINYKGKSHDGTREITEYSCAHCGFEVNKGMNYCYKCGTKIDWSQL